jgi:hypothetical protein
VKSSSIISSIEIINVLGGKIYSSNGNSMTSEIDLSNEPKGVYFYRIVTANKNISTGKLILE